MKLLRPPSGGRVLLGMLSAAMFGKTSVFLVGPMGSGKTAVGRHLARVLRLPIHDSDAEIERRTGVDIPFIFEKEVRPAFASASARPSRRSPRSRASCSRPVAARCCCRRTAAS